MDLNSPSLQRGDSVFRHPSSVTTPTNFISPSTTSRRHPSQLTSQSSLQSHHTVPENDDAAERRQRRRSKVLEMQRQFQSPGTPSERRRSLPLNGLNAGQVTDHYANCIKLSTENKINAKNAFGLHLIDYMADLLKEKTGEMTNFQVASCTLDASAKIYAGRVDSIHADTYKMLGGLGHGDRQNKEGEDGSTDAGERGTNATKKNKKARHSNTIESNLKNINLNKLDLGFEMDPLFHKTSAAFDEGGTYGLLLNHLVCRDDDCELLLDSTELVSSTFTQTEPLHPAKHEGVDLADLKDSYTGVNFDGLQICPAFSDFEFTNWNKDGQEDFSVMISKMAKSDQAFDVNAVPEPLEETNNGGHHDFGTDHYDAGGFSDDDNDYDGGESGGVGSMGEQSVFMADGQEAQMIGSSGCRTLSTAGQLCLQLSLQPTEYSYFDMDKLSTWAGPQHWKLKPHSKDKGEEKGKKSQTKKPVFRIDFSQEVDFAKYFSESKAATTLSKATLDKNKKNSNTLPEDLHYDPDDLFKLFLKPNFVIRKQANSSDNIDDGIEGYDYNNANDCANFCPNTGADDDDHDGGMDFCSEPSDFSQTCSQSSFINDSVFDATILQGDKLVAQPHKVAKIDIQYARTAKKMDVKKLKAVMWEHLITEPEQDKENFPSHNDLTKRTSVAGLQSFKDLYEQIPAKLSRTMSKNLSIPIAFVCLLHLANEKSLKIISDNEDLVITQD
ncbi:condensin complex subunit 2-like [Asterias amurensis]|uniref:condensin complex subunit 2-like n=1 Tax=Asterias amurensis TaxID=7602 RepID=UPI003AB70210